MQTWPPHKRKALKSGQYPVPYAFGLLTRKKHRRKVAPMNSAKGKPGIKFITAMPVGKKG